jgi:hypothetical protein
MGNLRNPEKSKNATVCVMPIMQKWPYSANLNKETQTVRVRGVSRCANDLNVGMNLTPCTNKKLINAFNLLEPNIS